MRNISFFYFREEQSGFCNINLDNSEYLMNKTQSINKYNKDIFITYFEFKYRFVFRKFDMNTICNMIFTVFCRISTFHEVYASKNKIRQE